MEWISPNTCLLGAKLIPSHSLDDTWCCLFCKNALIFFSRTYKVILVCWHRSHLSDRVERIVKLKGQRWYSNSVRWATEELIKTTAPHTSSCQDCRIKHYNYYVAAQNKKKYLWHPSCGGKHVNFVTMLLATCTMKKYMRACLVPLFKILYIS
jgi:hypothetical protein